MSSSRDFDVIHSHIGWGGHALAGAIRSPTRLLITQHNEITPDLEWFVSKHPDAPLTVLSNWQRSILKAAGAHSVSVIPNGIRLEQFPVGPGGRHLAYLGRIEDAKGAGIAVEVARSLDLPLLMAGPVIDDSYYESEIAPFLGDRIRYVGVIGHAEKTALLGDAACTIMPSLTAEAFGMVAIESMACGTPVIALANGALPEVVEDGITGFVGSTKADLAPLVRAAMDLDRGEVRRRVETRFSIDAVAERYLHAYERGAAAVVSDL